MAYALQFDGVNDYVDIPHSIALTNTTFTWRGKLGKVSGSDNGIFQDWNLLGGDNTQFVVWYDNPNGLSLVIRKSTTGQQINSTPITGLSIDVIYKIVVNVTNGVSVSVTVYDEFDSLINTTTTNHSNTYAPLVALHVGDDPAGLSRPFDGQLYSLNIDINGTIRNYDPSASNGTGTTLIDTVGGNNGTLVNFPTDDSQWIDLGGAVNYDLILDPGSYSYTGNTLNFSVGRKLDLNSGSYSYTGNPITLVYSPASINYDLVLEYGVYNVTGQPIQLSRGYSLTLSTGNYSYTGEQASLSYGRSLVLDAGNYSIIGYPISLNYSAFVDVRISGYTVKYSQNYYAATYKSDDVSAKYKSKDMAMKYGSLQ